jgi:hypothetical protein
VAVSRQTRIRQETAVEAVVVKVQESSRRQVVAAEEAGVIQTRQPEGIRGPDLAQSHNQTQTRHRTEGTQAPALGQTPSHSRTRARQLSVARVRALSRLQVVAVAVAVVAVTAVVNWTVARLGRSTLEMLETLAQITALARSLAPWPLHRSQLRVRGG